MHQKTVQHYWVNQIQTPEASHISPVQHNQPHLASPMLGLHCTHFLKPQNPSTPPPLFPICPRTVHGPRQAWFYCPTLIINDSSPECTSSVASLRALTTLAKLHAAFFHQCPAMHAHGFHQCPATYAHGYRTE